MSKIQRPEFGQQVTVKDRLTRRTRIKHLSKPRHFVALKEWVLTGDLYPFLEAEPVSGIYIGYRTYANGRRDYYADEGYRFIPNETFEVWLIVPGQRMNPVPVLPFDWR